MKHMTTREYSYDGHEFTYLLPAEMVERSEKESLEALMEVFQSTPCFGMELTGARIERDTCLVLDYLYEGWGEYHPFRMEFELVDLTDIQQVVLSGNVLHAIHDVFEIIIRREIMPEWTKTYQMKKY